MNAETFGAYLRAKRKARNLTLEELGAMVGLTKGHLSNIENGKRGIPSPELLFKLKEPLGVSHYHLMSKAGYLPEIPQDGIEPLETEFEEMEYRRRMEQHFDEIHEDAIKRSSLEFMLADKDSALYYLGHLLTDEDRQRILNMLAVLLPDRK